MHMLLHCVCVSSRLTGGAELVAGDRLWACEADSIYGRCGLAFECLGRLCKDMLHVQKPLGQVRRAKHVHLHRHGLLRFPDGLSRDRTCLLCLLFDSCCEANHCCFHLVCVSRKSFVERLMKAKSVWLSQPQSVHVRLYSL